MTLTVDDLRDFVETSLSDPSLGLLLDAAYEDIDRVLGLAGYDDEPASITELLTVGPGDLLMLSRPAEAVVSVVEDDDTELDDDDYELLRDQMLRRLDTGTNPRSCWYRRVKVTYAPLSDVASRDRAAIALVKLDLSNEPGVQSERLGDHSITFATGTSSYLDQREAILASIAGGFVAK